MCWKYLNFAGVGREPAGDQETRSKGSCQAVNHAILFFHVQASAADPGRFFHSGSEIRLTSHFGSRITLSKFGGGTLE
jgi:hypothetical protein